MSSVDYEQVCYPAEARSGVRVVGALPMVPRTACACEPSACFQPVCNRVNLLILGRQPYTAWPGSVATPAAPPPFNGQPAVAVTTGLPWAPVLVGRPGATLATGARAEALRQPFYQSFGPDVKTAAILTFNMTAGAPEGGAECGSGPPVSYKEAQGTVVAYPRVSRSKAAALTGTPAGSLTFVYRWCGPFTNPCTGAPLLGVPVFEEVATTATSVRFRVLSQPVAVNMGFPDVTPVQPRCTETAVLLLVEQACPPVPSCLTPCTSRPVMGSTVSNVVVSTQEYTHTLTAQYSNFGGVANLRVEPVEPAPEDVASAVVQPLPLAGGPPTVVITIMVGASPGFGDEVQFRLVGDILSPPCEHDSYATRMSVLITVSPL